jgi:hypothetical protein
MKNLLEEATESDGRREPGRGSRRRGRPIGPAGVRASREGSGVTSGYYIEIAGKANQGGFSAFLSEFLFLLIGPA